MNERERLIDIMTSYFGVDPGYYGIDAPHLADYLLANGVTVSEEVEELKADNLRLCEMWAKAVSDLSKAEASLIKAKRWIPVTERLPYDEGERLLVCYSDGWICDQYTPFDNGVTHWMPLPEPPKEE